MAEITHNKLSELSSSPFGGELNRVIPTGEIKAKPQARFGGGYYYQPNTQHAKKMRQEMTPWEFQLWQQLKGKKLDGHKFRRQQPVGRYIVDFINIEKKLIIELDGSQHVESTDDKRRDEYMQCEGYRVLRFWNNEVNENIEGVLSRILSALEVTPHRNASAFRLPPKGGATELASRAESKRLEQEDAEIDNGDLPRSTLTSSPLEGEAGCVARALNDRQSVRGELVGSNA